MSAVYLLLLLVPAISAQTFHWGACPTPNVQSNFTLQPYMGMWYEIEKLPDIFGRGQCIREENTMMEDGSVQVSYSQVWDPQNHQGKRWYLEGTAKVIDPQEPAKLGVNFMSFLPYTPYWVLSTDYTHYSIAYSCKDVFGIFYFDFAWILAWSPSLPPQMVGQAKQMLIKRLNRLIRRASSALGCPLDPVEVVSDRRMVAKLSSLLDNISHPMQETVTALNSSFSGSYGTHGVGRRDFAGLSSPLLSDSTTKTLTDKTHTSTHVQ